MLNEKKIVLVTGASRGIGQAIARRFAKEGYAVVMHYHTGRLQAEQTAAELQAQGACVLLQQADIRDSQQVQTMIETVQRQWGNIDILVNNAGIGQQKLFTDITDTEWRNMFAVHVDGTFYCSRAVLPAMISRKAGCIINISSMWGTSGASCEAAYSASKAGVDGLTKALAKELAPSGIPVNAVSFGVIDTAMNSQLSEDERLVLEEEIPMGRFASPEEAARLIYEIALSPTYLTGQIIRMDGGFL